MMQELIIIRGLPGSGKSTFAENMKNALDYCAWEGDGSEPGWLHVETDQFFTQGGQYSFDSMKLQEAHTWCQDTVRTALHHGYSVIVSNTFTRIWEMRPYLDMAEKLDIKCTIIEVQGYFGSIHNVPEETIQKMKNRWERYPA